MAADVRMDYDAVQQLADGFRASADTLRAVDQALEVAVALLKSSVFLGLVGNMGMAAYLENIQPHLRRLAATCDELHNDLLGAIASLRDGDYTGSQRFVGGARPSRSGHSTPLSLEDGQLYTSNGSRYAGSGSSVNRVFINGILTSSAGFIGGLEQVNAAWGGADVVGLYNGSEGKIPDVLQAFDDKIQALGYQRLATRNPAVESLKELIRQNANGDRKLELIAHSQGSAIVSAALSDLYREDPDLVSFVEVTTFGAFGTNFPPGPTYHHYIHDRDLVPFMARLIAPANSPGDMARFYASMTVIQDKPDFLANDFGRLIDHDLESYLRNLNQFRQTESAIDSAPAPFSLLFQAKQIVDLILPL